MLVCRNEEEIMKAIVGGSGSYSTVQCKLADLNKDGIINIRDLILMKKLVGTGA